MFARRLFRVCPSPRRPLNSTSLTSWFTMASSKYSGPRTLLSPREFPSSGFEVIDPSQRVEEESLPSSLNYSSQRNCEPADLVDGDCDKRRPKPVGENARTYSYGAALALTVYHTWPDCGGSYSRCWKRSTMFTCGGSQPDFGYERVIYTVSRVRSKHTTTRYILSTGKTIILLVGPRSTYIKGPTSQSSGFSHCE
jgi:hypothetical protein